MVSRRRSHRNRVARPRWAEVSQSTGLPPRSHLPSREDEVPMRRHLLWFVAGALTLVIAAGLCGLIFLKVASNGFSARAEPSFLEQLAAKQARSMAMPSSGKERKNPI